jgi:LmbE family N-acetylglucosaminyl deacetylase
VELGCGGTLAQHVSDLEDVNYLVVSPAMEDIRNRNILGELGESCRYLKLGRDPIVWKYPRRRLHEYRNEIRQKLWRLVEERLKPDLIFVPSLTDLHQDHHLVAEEAIRLFRNRSVLGYEIFNSSNGFKPALYVQLSPQSLQVKVNAVMSYTSQHHREYFNEEAVRAHARVRGVQVHTRYAEAFEIHRMVL